jgi:hypothetical protein
MATRTEFLVKNNGAANEFTYVARGGAVPLSPAWLDR